MKKILLSGNILLLSLFGFSQTVLLPINTGFDADPSGFVNYGGLIYFIAYSNSSGYELWKSDGTPAGTVMAVDINPGSGNGMNGSIIRIMNGLMYFFANDGVHGFELWKSDGTTGGTSMIKDIYPGINNSSTTNALTINPTTSKIYFFGRDTSLASHYGLWISDGTTGNATMLAAIATTSNPEIFVDSNLVYFDSYLTNNGDELCVSDGTPGGTQLLKDIRQGVSSSTPRNFTKFGNKIIFTATDSNGIEPFITDGTAAGTMQLKDINAYGDSRAFGYTVYNQTVLFFANDSTHGYEPWITDGTPGGTQLLKDLSPGAAPASMSIASSPRYVLFNSKAFFSPGSTGPFYYTDGTTTGTIQFMQGTGYTSPFLSYAPSGGRLYFVGKKTPFHEVWSTANGTDSMQHTFNTPAVYTYTDMFIGNNAIYLVNKNSFADKALYTLGLATCSPKVNITGNTPLTCSQHIITLTVGNYSHYNWSTGDSTSQINVTTVGTYIVNVQDTVLGCISSDTVQVVMTHSVGLGTVAICGVTVDSATGINKIIWSKHNTSVSEILFRIEKETGTNIFTPIADIPYDSLSAYFDTTANPQVTSYRYRLSVLDSCGNSSTPSAVHETVHLSQNMGINGEANLIWNAYIGTSYAHLNVLRSVNGAVWTNISVLSGNVVSYSDLTPPAGTLNYQLEVLIDSTCTPTRSLFSLFSNRVSLVTTGIQEIAANELSLYPNPVSSVLQIRLPENIHDGNILITDLTGRTVRIISVTDSAVLEDVSELTNGIYFVRHSSNILKLQHFLKH